MLISFEGIDGCGKSTQIDLLKSYFSKKKVSYHVFREPGGTGVSEKIRDLLLHGAEEISPVSELLLFSAARSQLLTEKVIPILRTGDTVILDRFYDSTTAYQGYGRNSASIDQINALNAIATHNTVPNLTFYLRIEPELAEERTADGDKDRMESSGVEFFKRVCDGYDQIAEKESRFRTIDASKKPEEIHLEIVQHLESL